VTELVAQHQVRASFAHRCAGLNSVATERGKPEKASRRGVETSDEAAIGNEAAKASPRAHRALDPHRRGAFDAIDRHGDVEVFRLNIVRFDRIGIRRRPSRSPASGLK
jgi:hypothetical protein